MIQCFPDREKDQEDIKMVQQMENFQTKSRVFEAIDLIVNGIKDWFDQPSYQLLEELFVNASNKEPL